MIIQFGESKLTLIETARFIAGNVSQAVLTMACEH